VKVQYGTKPSQCGDYQDSIFHLDQDWLARLTRRDFAEISCGAASQLFCFPTFTIERKSDSGSSYVAQNQLLGSLLCIYESMKVSHRHIDKNLPVMALGLVNVGNWVELWGLWPGTNGIATWHIHDFHMFNVVSCIELSSFLINMHNWIQNYQTNLFVALSTTRPPTSDRPLIPMLKRSPDPCETPNPDPK